jgi:hypothetical protein
MRLAIALVLVLGCSSKPPAKPPAAGESCTDDTSCSPPATCIHVVGQMPESARQECWITCGDKSCPDGTTCTMIHDGPGKVCVVPDAD